MPTKHPAPAIRRTWKQEDSNVNVIRTPYDRVSFTRGMGDSGSKMQIVERDCPACHYDRMIRKVHVSPVERDRAEYWCSNLSCPHFVGEQFGFARVQRPTQPLVCDVTAICPDCDERHTIEIDTRTEGIHPTNEDHLKVALCDDCQVDRAERRAGV